MYLLLDIITNFCILCYSNIFPAMKTLPEFLSLTIEEQFDYVWNYCTHLASCEEEKFIVHLYSGKGLIVEVWFNECWDVVRIRPFTKYRIAKPCSENSSVENR